MQNAANVEDRSAMETRPFVASLHFSDEAILSEIEDLHQAILRVDNSITQIGRDLSAVIGERARIEHRLEIILETIQTSQDASMRINKCVLS